jgi:hypothetical protein
VTPEPTIHRHREGGQSSHLDGLTQRLTASQAILSDADRGFGGFGNIASQAAMKGAALAKSFASVRSAGFRGVPDQSNVDPDDSGQHGLGQKGLGKVNSALDELNTYSDQTIYNFSRDGEEHRYLHGGRCGAARRRPHRSRVSPTWLPCRVQTRSRLRQRCISCLRPLPRVKVGLQDWNSVVNAGMGGAVFQKALMQYRCSHGERSRRAPSRSTRHG